MINYLLIIILLKNLDKSIKLDKKIEEDKNLVPKIGPLTIKERKEKIERYRQKKINRINSKQKALPLQKKVLVKRQKNKGKVKEK